MSYIFGIIFVFICFIIYNHLKISNDKERDSISSKTRRKEISQRIYKKEQDKIKSRTFESIVNKIEIVNQIDDFENTELTYFNNISIDNYDHIPMYYEKITIKTENDHVPFNHIGISFSVFRDNIFLDITSYAEKQMGLAKGDVLKLLFENKKRLDIVFETKASTGDIKTNSHLLSVEDLSIFALNNLEKWKLTSVRRSVYVMGDNTYFSEENTIQNKKTFQKVLKYLAKTITKEFVKKQNKSIN